MKRVLILALLVLLGLVVAWWKYSADQPASASAELRAVPADKAAQINVPDTARPQQRVVAKTLPDSAASAVEFPDLEQACSELPQSRRAEGNSNWTPWFVKHYPNELAVLTQYGSGAQTNWVEFEAMNAEILRQQAQSGNFVSAGVLGSRLSVEFGLWTASHLARLQEAEKWLLLAIQNREPGLWHLYAMTRAQLVMWPTSNRIMELRAPEQTIPNAEVESQISALRETERQAQVMERRAIFLFSRPYQMPLDRIMFSYMGRLGAWKDISDDDPRILARVAALDEAFKGADLYVPNDLQRSEMEVAEQTRKAMEEVRSRIADACGSTTRFGSWIINDPAG